jgi:uncharacterized protein
MTKVLCIYHAHCADGLGAAWAVHRALGEGVEFVAAKYGEDPPYMTRVSNKDLGTWGKLGEDYIFKPTGIEGRDILIVDFSYPLPVLRAMAQEAHSVLVIDHHATAQKDLQNPDQNATQGLVAPASDEMSLSIASAERRGLFTRRLRTRGSSGTHPPHMPFHNWLEYCGDELRGDDTNLAAIFDLERSGAGLTWDYLHPKSANLLPLGHRHDGGSFGGGDQGECYLCGKDAILHEPRESPRPRIIDLIEDRDLWKFRFGDETRAFHAVLTSYDIGDLPAMFLRMDHWAKWADDPNADARSVTKRGAWGDVLAEGSAILRAQSAAVTSAVAASRRTIRIAGHVVPCANVPGSMASDAGHLLCQPEFEPLRAIHGALMDNASFFSATYYDGADGKRHFSLRSPEGGADVGRIAVKIAVLFNRTHEHIWQDTGKSFTGGGHEHAAGFDAPIDWEGE